MKLKIFILISLLTVCSFTTKAQNLTFEQTVDYINEIIKTNVTAYYVNGATYAFYVNEAKVEKNGRISFYYNEIDKTRLPRGSFNVFDLERTEWLGDRLRLKTKDNVEFGYFSNLSQPDGDRLLKAIMYLKKVCTKSADPFGN